MHTDTERRSRSFLWWWRLVRAVGVASAVAGYLGQQHIIISFFVCARRAGAAWRRRYRRGACPPSRVKVIKGTKVELAVCQRLTHRNAGIFPLGVGQRHIIISFFVCTRRAGARRRRYRKGACGAAASQRRLWRQAPRRRLAELALGGRLPSRGREVINHKTWLSVKSGGVECEFEG